jgi:YtcA family
MKRRVCSYDMLAVPDASFVLKDTVGEMYFCNLRCFCVWSVQLATRRRVTRFPWIFRSYRSSNRDPATPVLTSHARLLLLLAQTALLSGCSGAPSLAIAGAYFPAWLACAVVGVITTVIARGLMASTHLTTVIPFQLAVCTAIGVLVALAVWLSWAVH